MYKVCKKCGEKFETEEIFLAKTKFVGVQSFAPYNLLSLELRDCYCNTTLARRLPILSNNTTLKPALA